MLILGAHMSIAEGFLAALQKTVRGFKANALQIFIKSPRSIVEKQISPQEHETCRNFVKKNDIQCFIAHGSYLVNLAKDARKAKWMFHSITNDLKHIVALGGSGLVVHFRKQLDLPHREAMKFFAMNLKLILDQTEDGFLLIENTAGMGTEMGHTFDDLATLLTLLKGHPRLRFVLDTAHLFGAGYDLRTPKSVQKTFKEFDTKVGLNRLAVIHLNDSAVPLGSKKDRHEYIGQGHIGKEGLLAVIQFAEKKSIPLILETSNDSAGHRRDLNLIRTWLK